MLSRFNAPATRAFAFVCVAVLLALAAAAIAAPAPTRTVRVSVSSSGAQTHRDSSLASLSHTGRFVAFKSNDEELVPGDTNGWADVFVHDLKTRKTKRVSLSSTGRQGNQRSSEPSISSNGRYVAFRSRASNLARRDRNKGWDVFVRDLKRNKTTLASILPGGKHGGSDAVISADGRSVAFRAYDKIGATGDLFVRHLKTHKTERVTVSQTGGKPDAGSVRPSISGDGRLIAFNSYASNLVPDDTNSEQDVFVRDLKTRVTRRIRGGSRGGGSLGISADGRFVVFGTGLDLVGGDPDKGGIFRHDLEQHTSEQIELSSSGEEQNAPNSAFAISAHANFLVFSSYASNLVPDDTNESSNGLGRDIFVRDIANRTTTRVSVTTAGKQANAGSDGPAISGDGRFAGFESEATNLGGDTNRRLDVFVRGPLRP
jgi:Tol biopolymer transport system component